MKNHIWSIAILFFIIACDKDCESNIAEDCDVQNLKIIDPNCIDLYKYTIRHDTSYQFGYSNCIKSIPGKGEIDWIANNRFFKFGLNYYLGMTNYADTSYVDLELWAFLREGLAIKISDLECKKYIIYSEYEFRIDSNLNYGIYNKNFDDFFGEAKWDIDTRKQSYLSIDKIDTLPSNDIIITGKYDLNFKMTKQSTDPKYQYQEIIRFRCGQFRTKLF
ncbi:MAG: hypothetical protein M3Q56_13045 [Bacteroidota bacterium]|nr:hypothetical protein [Bacteroidota bacterium]